MKKFLSILFLLILAFLPFQAYAQTATDIEESSESAKIEYFLPYPGMLPGSPLYPLKTLRDRIIEFFISDPSKRAEFYILQADKRLSAGIALSDKGESELSETTISKAEKYLEKALAQAEEVKKRGINNDSLIQNIQLSLEKHQEVIEGLAEKSDENVSEKFQLSLELNKKVQNRVIQLEPAE